MNINTNTKIINDTTKITSFFFEPLLIHSNTRFWISSIAIQQRPYKSWEGIKPNNRLIWVPS